MARNHESLGRKRLSETLTAKPRNKTQRTGRSWWRPARNQPPPGYHGITRMANQTSRDRPCGERPGLSRSAPVLKRQRGRPTDFPSGVNGLECVNGSEPRGQKLGKSPLASGCRASTKDAVSINMRRLVQGALKSLGGNFLRSPGRAGFSLAPGRPISLSSNRALFEFNSQFASKLGGFRIRKWRGRFTQPRTLKEPSGPALHQNNLNNYG